MTKLARLTGLRTIASGRHGTLLMLLLLDFAINVVCFKAKKYICEMEYSRELQRQRHQEPNAPKALPHVFLGSSLFLFANFGHF